MKKTLTFIPLGIGISAAIIYIFNVIQFKVINNSTTLLQILANLKVYLYVSIAGFICYFLVKILNVIDDKRKIIEVVNDNEPAKEVITDNTYEPFEKTNIEEKSNTVDNAYVPNYDYVPVYHEESDIINLNAIENINISNEDNEIIAEPKKEIKKSISGNKYCFNCGEKICDTDSFCSVCGTSQIRLKKQVNPILKNIINVLEIVILLLIIYFSLNMLFDYKEKQDSSFKSPFKVRMTK